MEGLVVLFLALVIATEAHQPHIKVYEIRQAKDHALDDQYYDPSNYKTAYNIPHEDRRLEHLVANIIERLHHLSKRERDDGKVVDDDDSDSDAVFHDETRSLPILLVPDKKLVQQRKPKTMDLLQKLWKSVLRTEDVEDRTAAARHNNHFENDYKDK